MYVNILAVWSRLFNERISGAWNLRPTVAHPIKGNPKQSWIPDFTPWIPDSRYWSSWPLSVELGFRILILVGFRIPRKVFRIQNQSQDSGFHEQKVSKIPKWGFHYMGRSRASLKIHLYQTYTVSQIYCFPCISRFKLTLAVCRTFVTWP